MEFKEFKNLLKKNFKRMSNGEEVLFEADVDKYEIWDKYLESFPEGTNELFRERREFDCSCCKQFIRYIGGAGVIKNNQFISIWDFEVGDEKFQPVVDELKKYVYSKPVKSVFYSESNKVGTEKNMEMTDEEIIEWDHFHLNLDDKFVENKDEIATKKSRIDSSKQVFKRSLDEITDQAVEDVIDLINDDNLYRGSSWEDVLNKFLNYKVQYNEIADEKEKNLFSWSNSVKAGELVSKIRNSSIGTLLIDLSEGMDLEKAIKRYENVTAPTNYKRSKPVFSKRMLDDAKEKIKKLGYLDSLQRRFATLDDVSINNIIFSNKDAQKRLADVEDVFDELEAKIPLNPDKIRASTVTLNDFINDIAPDAEEIEVLLENKYLKNLVSLTTSKQEDSKPMFKWGNNLGWSYKGNIADSMIKDNVAMKGGKVDGDLRFSIQWNDGKNHNINDFDAHCITPSRGRIYFGDKKDLRTKGELDVDIRTTQKGIPAVENITWNNKIELDKGEYKFIVHNFSSHRSVDGFKAEIEYNGEVHEFQYDLPLRGGEEVDVAVVSYDGDGFEMKKDFIGYTSSNKEDWNLTTNTFVPVSVLMSSPNYFMDNKSGNHHYFFMLKNCINNENPNGFYVEFLNEELRENRKVMEALSSKMKVESTDDQLSGIGFSTSKKYNDELVVKVKSDNKEKTFKVLI